LVFSFFKLTAQDSVKNTLTKKIYTFVKKKFMPDKTYAHINVSVDCVVFGWSGTDLNVLLIEQKRPEQNKHLPARLALPGDLVLTDEGLDEAADRILEELTRLRGIYQYQFHTFGNPERVKELKDQDWLRAFREHPEAHVITVAYYSLIRMEDFQPEASSFASKTQWFKIPEIPELAFDHNEIVNRALSQLRTEVEQKKVGFELLPEKFTLSQIQNLHEAILERKLDKRNFRKSIKKLETIIPLNEKQVGVTHKPGQLFSYAENGNEVPAYDN
jgi:8-oxo-dGTP diphosphatase